MRRTILLLGLCLTGVCWMAIPAEQCQAAIHASTVWECRATGNVANGGGYNPANATPGTDRSQQDAAEDSGTDLACADGDAASPVVTSATHNFVDADEGNIIRISEAGTGFTLGWYEVVSTSANAATLDRACGANGALTGGDWALGGAIALGSTAIDAEFWQAGSGNGVVAGNTVYCKGAWSLSEAMNATGNDGTGALPIKVIGYATTRATIPYGDDLPNWDMGANAFVIGDYWIVRNIHLTGTGTYVISPYANCVLDNCIVTNTSGTANRSAIYPGGTDTTFRGCIVSSTNGYGIEAGEVCQRVLDSFIYTSAAGMRLGNRSVAVNNVIYNCTIGASLLGYGHTYYGNSFSTCATAFSGGENNACTIINNIIDNSATAEATWTSAQMTYCAYNCWGEATPTLTNVTAGITDILSDPGLTSPAGGDFTVGAASVVLNAGSFNGANLGLTGAYKQNIGVDQDDQTAGGSTVIMTPDPVFIQ
jgi:hypothetical protein